MRRAGVLQLSTGHACALALRAAQNVPALTHQQTRSDEWCVLTPQACEQCAPGPPAYCNSCACGYISSFLDGFEVAPQSTRNFCMPDDPMYPQNSCPSAPCANANSEVIQCEPVDSHLSTCGAAADFESVTAALRRRLAASTCLTLAKVAVPVHLHVASHAPEIH